MQFGEKLRSVPLLPVLIRCNLRPPFQKRWHALSSLSFVPNEHCVLTFDHGGRSKSDSTDGLGVDRTRRQTSEIHRWTDRTPADRRRAISSTATPKPRSFAAA